MNINEYLNRPFPFIYGMKMRLLVSLSIAVFIFFFLLIFQPFEIWLIASDYKLWFILGYTLVSLVALIGSFLGLELVRSPAQWTLKKNLLFILTQVVASTIGVWWFNSTFGVGITTQHSLAVFLFIVLMISVMPVMFTLHFVEKILRKERSVFSEELTQVISHKQKIVDQSTKQEVDAIAPSLAIENNINTSQETEEIALPKEEITIESQNQNETMKLLKIDFVCAKSSGNYISVYYKNKGGIVSKIIRNSISKLEKELGKYDKIKRCHRSFIVNFENVNEVSGNARNFNLHVNNLDFLIPVSRNFPRNTLKELVQ